MQPAEDKQRASDRDDAPVDDFVGKDHAVEPTGETDGPQEHQHTCDRCQFGSGAVTASGKGQDSQCMKHLVASRQFALLEFLVDLFLREALGLEAFGQTVSPHRADGNTDGARECGEDQEYSSCLIHSKEGLWLVSEVFERQLLR